MSNLKNNIAQNIALLRTQNNMTQQDLAEKLNYSNKAISKWENGDSLPDIEVLEEIATMFNKDIPYLLEDPQKNSASIKDEKQGIKIRHKKLLVCLFMICIVWMAAALIYTYVFLNRNEQLWQVFLWCVPISALILLCFSSIWALGKYNEIFASIFMWVLLLAVFLQFLQYNLFLIFIVGVPAQLIILLWCSIKKE